MEANLKLRTNIRVGIVISYLTILAGIVVTIFYTPFMINSVGIVEHGIYSFVSSIVSWFSILTVGIAGAYVRFATKYNTERGEIGVGKLNSAFSYVLFFGATIGIVFGIVTFILLFWNVIPLNAYSTYEKNLIFQLLFVGIVHMLFSFVIMFFNAFNTYKNKFIIVRGIALLVVIITPIITVPFLLNGFNVLIVSLVKFAVDIFALILYFLLTVFQKSKLRFIKISDTYEKKIIIKEIVYFCVFIMLYVTIDTINKSSDKLVLGFFGLPQMVSIYGLGRAFLEYAYLATVYISANYIQIINQKIIENRKEEINLLFLKLSNVALLLMVYIFGGFLVTGDIFVSSWLANSAYTRPEMNQIYWVALTLIFINIVPFSQVSAIEIQRGYNKHLRPTLILLITALTNILLTILLILIMPRENAVWACLISTTITTVVSQWFILNIYYQKELFLDIKKYYSLFAKRIIIVLFPIVITYLLFKLTNLEILMSGWVAFVVEGLCYTSVFVTSLFIFERKTVANYFAKFNKKRFR